MNSQAIRGCAINFAVTFLDQNGVLVTPGGANLYLSYAVLGVVTTQTVAMTLAGTGFAALWDSSVADPGEITWFANATTSIKAAVEGTITLRANDANNYALPAA